MISFISRSKNVFLAGKSILKLEAVDSRFYSTFKRILCVNNYLTSNVLIHQPKNEPFNRRNYCSSKNVPENFGKIVELDYNINELVTENAKINSKGGKKKKKSKSEPLMSSEQEKEVESERESECDTRSFKSMYKNASLASSLLSELKSKKNKNSNQIVIEGKRLVKEAINAGMVPLKVFFTRASDLETLPLPESTETFRVPFRTLSLWSDCVAPQGCIGIFKKPIPKPFTGVGGLPLTVICDNIRDPGNLGSIIRVVVGAGCEKLILTRGCVHVWDQKVLRAGAGAQFHLPILRDMTWTDIESNISEKYQVLLADNNIALNNMEGISSSTNFNKAYEHLPKCCYFSLEFQENSVLILGGETLGLSDEAYEFAVRRNGTRVLIPLSRKIESLNAAVALGILTFDFRRQLYNKTQKESDFPMTYSGSEIS